MAVPVLTFFSNKGGVGRTTLVYNLSWMFAERGTRVMVVDLDPQAVLTAAFLDDESLAEIWLGGSGTTSISRSMRPLSSGGDFAPVDYRVIDPCLALVPGDLDLAGFEDNLSISWDQALNKDSMERSCRMWTAFWRSAQDAAERFRADIILFDVSPGLGAINRAALAASDFFIVPIGADVMSLVGLRNLGPSLRNWRDGWRRRIESWVHLPIEQPVGQMNPMGYVVSRLRIVLSRPVRADMQWLRKVPVEFRQSVMGQDIDEPLAIDADPYCLAMLKDFSSLLSLTAEARKPIFLLRPADGAVGSRASAVQMAYSDFRILAETIEQRVVAAELDAAKARNLPGG